MCIRDSTWVKRELSVTLVRGNARLFKKFVGVLTRGVGQRFVEGMDVPREGMDVPAGVLCLCPYDNMLPIGPVNFTHTHTHT